MISLKIRVLIMLVISVLLIEYITAPTKEEVDILRMYCKIRLRKLFSGSDVRALAKNALQNYLRSYQMNVQSEEYYKLFDTFLHKGSIPTPENFCEERKETDKCITTIITIFGRDSLQNLKKAFYELRSYDIFSIHESGDPDNLFDDTVDYWNLIVEDFGLDLGPNGMPSPNEFCNKKHTVSPDHNENEEPSYETGKSHNISRHSRKIVSQSSEQ